MADDDGQVSCVTHQQECRLLSSYEALRHRSVREEVGRLERTARCMEEEWQAEVDLYSSQHHLYQNEANAEGVIQDSRLFPYHEALYPLLDMHYHFDNFRDELLTRKRVVLPSPVMDVVRRVQDHNEVRVFGYVPNSAYAIWTSLLPRHRANKFRSKLLESANDDATVADDLASFGFDFLDEWAFAIAGKETLSDDHDGLAHTDVTHVREVKEITAATALTKGRFSDEQYGPSKLPFEQNERSKILLKVLRHALSDLQRDHRLARAALLLLIDLKCCDVCETDGIVECSESGVETLRRIFSIMAAEYIHGCDRECHARFLDQQIDAMHDVGDMDDDDMAIDSLPSFPNHYCADWKECARTLGLLVSHGITNITVSHAAAMSAFVLAEYDGASEAARAMDEKFFESYVTGENGPTDNTIVSKGVASNGKAAIESRQKILLKQTLFHYKNTDYEDDSDSDPGVFGTRNESQEKKEPFRIHLVRRIVQGLGHHAIGDRARILKLLKAQKPITDTESVSTEEILANDNTLELERAVNSYYNCIRALVDIGENTVRRLPSNQCNALLGGQIVRSLVTASIIDVDVGMPTFGYLGQKKESLPTRYANAITNASQQLEMYRDVAMTMFHSEHGIALELKNDSVFREIFLAAPHADVQDVIRALYIRDLVDVYYAGCGYGDFLVWCRLPISPLDPLLFDHSLNYPDDPEDCINGMWCSIADPDDLQGKYIEAQYDFTLLLLVRAWNAPWTPQSHLSFQRQFRDSVKTLTLCAHRYGVPPEIVRSVISYLPRSWWPDERECCWCQDCQREDLSQSIRGKILSREASCTASTRMSEAVVTSGLVTLEMKKGAIRALPPRGILKGRTKGSGPMQKCPDCHVAMYCSSEHRKLLWQEGHKRVCKTPPYCIPGPEEEAFCQAVLGGSKVDVLSFQDDEVSVTENEISEEGSSCWESVDSDDGSSQGHLRPKSERELIYKFFDSKSYKLRKRDPPAFVNVYQRQD